MGRALVRDVYTIEHWVDESALAFAPWNDCEVLAREPYPEELEEAEAERAAAAELADPPLNEPPSESSEAKPAKPRKPATE